MTLIRLRKHLLRAKQVAATAKRYEVRLRAEGRVQAYRAAVRMAVKA